MAADVPVTQGEGEIKKQGVFMITMMKTCLILSILDQVQHTTGLILGLHPANERCRYKVKPRISYVL